MSVAHDPTDDEDYLGLADFVYDVTFYYKIHHVVCVFGLVNSILTLFVLRASYAMPNPDSPALVLLRHSAVANMLTFMFERSFLDFEYYFGLYISSALEGPLCHALVHISQTGLIVHYLLAGLFSLHQYLCAMHSSSKWTRFMRKRFSRLCEWVWCIGLLLALPSCWTVTMSGNGHCFGVPLGVWYRSILIDIGVFCLLAVPVLLQLRWLVRSNTLLSAMLTIWRSNRLSMYFVLKSVCWVFPCWLIIEFHARFYKGKTLLPDFVLMACETYLMSFGVDFIFFCVFAEEFRLLLPKIN
ncbi:uncharacterized protein LOC100906843 [Galendromus occidentalis]|uniref:Uncharacterized protein LOC100906843 n=1 Tax=Galendromus occidentalis TaxID=34638 RepID=A0AAJ6VXX5_9ACAR|nr:uncharacterized protein LOC100906843 [Galendromus occidentalis]